MSSNGTIEVYEEQAPISSGSFLAHVDGGYFEGGAFWRTVTTENDNGSPIIEVIQGGVIGEVTGLPTVEHESTRDSGLLHEDGIVSLGRSDPGTASGASFFICIGDQLALEFGATRNPDGLGFAAFGRVVEGMDVVRAIHRREANAPSDDPYTDGQLLTEYVSIASAHRQESTGDEDILWQDSGVGLVPLVGNHPVQSQVHLFRANEFALAAPRQDLSQSGCLMLVGVHSLTQQIDALLQYRAQAGETPGLDQRSGKGVLFVGERD